MSNSSTRAASQRRFSVATLSSAQFEALWENAKSQPGFRKADTKPIQVDLSLSGILNQYMAMAARHRDKGRISQIDYDELAVAVTALKVILVRINDSDLVAEAMSQNAVAIEQQVREKVAKLAGSLQR
jgi:hypothetical protein